MKNEIRRRSAIVGALIGVLVVTGRAASEEPVAPDFQAFDAKLLQACKSETFSGVVSVTRQGRPIYQRACGLADRASGAPMTVDTRFKIFSISKMITGTAILALVDRHVLALDAPAQRYIANLPPAWRAITMRQLLQHTSGVPDLTEDLLKAFQARPTAGWSGAMATVLASARDKPLLETPGQKWRYNNFGYELLALATQNATHKPFERVVREFVFDPAGMTGASMAHPLIERGKITGSVAAPGLATGYACKKDGGAPAISYQFVQRGAGAVYASAHDLDALDHALSQGRLVSGDLQAQGIREAFKVNATNWYAFGTLIFELGGRRYLEHSGGNNGYVSETLRPLDEDLTITTLSNDPCADTNGLRNDLLKILFPPSIRSAT